MKLKIALLALVAATPALADNYVNGYFRKDGTYVEPHYRSNNDGQRWNNYSTQGNTNPYTGQKGTEDPYKLPSYNNNYGANNLGSRPRY